MVCKIRFYLSKIEFFINLHLLRIVNYLGNILFFASFRCTENILINQFFGLLIFFVCYVFIEWVFYLLKCFHKNVKVFKTRISILNKIYCFIFSIFYVLNSLYYLLYLRLIIFKNILKFWNFNVIYYSVVILCKIVIALLYLCFVFL